MSATHAHEEMGTAVWDQHLASEFAARDAKEALRTMGEHPIVISAPVMMGGVGRKELYEFYSKYFLNQLPPDIVATPISRTVGQGRIVDELHFTFTHTQRTDFVLPGIAPTGKRVEIIIVVIATIKDGKVEKEHLYWDQASVLAQVGLIDPKTVPAVGAEGTRQVLNPILPMNERARSSQPQE